MKFKDFPKGKGDNFLPVYRGQGEPHCSPLGEFSTKTHFVPIFLEPA
jgi:hypothetical protein